MKGAEGRVPLKQTQVLYTYVNYNKTFVFLFEQIVKQTETM